jgi:hypothetical protein
MYEGDESWVDQDAAENREDPLAGATVSPESGGVAGEWDGEASASSSEAKLE